MESPELHYPLALTFDDILLIPSFADFTRSDISLKTRLTKKITLEAPFVSSPMDTVTESKLAVELAKMGGIGMIHRNLTINAQAKEVSIVKKEKLPVGAAISVGKDLEARSEALVRAGVDILVTDTAHGYTNSIIEGISYLKNKYPDLAVMSGNVATYEGALAMIKAGADCLRVGMGPGAICTTRVISGMGVPQVTAIKEVVRTAKKYDIPIIADGGIRYSGDMTKALALGAEAVMMGSLFAACKESPGRVIKLQKNDVPARFKSILNHNTTYLFKEYRGMGSAAAMKVGVKVKSGAEYHGKDYYKERVLVAEGVEAMVPIKGSVRHVIEQAIGGIKSGMYYVGAKNLRELHKKAKFYQITTASLSESHPHDVFVTNPGASY
jgi:IMP dehydrogenase